ncbi:MAG TPA: biotin--[acetyl-CoA-carboxylase] ligase [Roseiarcus sp.]|nr:biotin--[acetyl-CoA-carboxylase] ligase [Roseiarcus sp.]
MSAPPEFESAPGGWRVGRLGAIDSTNEEARRRAFAGDPGRLWVMAEEQSAGRGRRGRNWESPKGNLHASALLIDPCPRAAAAQLGFVAGVALARAAKDLGASRARLKWPNDLVCEGAKCAGVLVEGATLPDKRLACVIGVGVNCSIAPTGIGCPTAILASEGGGPIEAGVLFGRLIARFDEALLAWRAGEAFDAIRSAWLAHAAALGVRIRIESGERRREGAFEGLDGAGRLLFRGESGIERIESADLWILPQSDGSPVAASSASLAREGPD